MAYKDIMGHPELRPKLFFRTDLYDVVAGGKGFRELTHVQDRASPQITWDEGKLLHMIMERFAFNQSIRERYGLYKEDIQKPDVRRDVFFEIFPKQIDVGSRRPDTWKWMLSRIRDSNNVSTPRDLHDLVVNSAHIQIERLARGEDETESELIGSRAIKSGLAELSREKVRTTLIAENPDAEKAIRAFNRQKAEQNADTLQHLLGDDWKSDIQRLERIGFLERTGSSWKVPLLYRDGLEITQGAAFPKRGGDEGQEDD